MYVLEVTSLEHHLWITMSEQDRLYTGRMMNVTDLLTTLKNH